MGSDSYILGKGIVEHLSSDRSSSVAANSKLLYFDCVTLAQCFCRLRVIANVHTLTRYIYTYLCVIYIYSALLCCSCYTNSLIYLITYNMTDNLYRSIIHVNTLAIAFYAGGKKVAIQILGTLVYGYNLHKHMQRYYDVGDNAKRNTVFNIQCGSVRRWSQTSVFILCAIFLLESMKYVRILVQFYFSIPTSCVKTKISGNFIQNYLKIIDLNENGVQVFKSKLSRFMKKKQIVQLIKISPEIKFTFLLHFCIH